MKRTKRILFFLLTIIMSGTVSIAQNVKSGNSTLQEVQQPQKNSEILLGVVTDERYGGRSYDIYEKVQISEDMDPYTKGYLGADPYKYMDSYTDIKNYTVEEMLSSLISKAKKEYGKEYPNFLLRDFKYTRESKYESGSGQYRNKYDYTWKYSASVVITNPKSVANDNLSKAIDKALMNVQEGSRIALDQIRVPTEIDKEEYKDQVVELLLDKGFKVVAKDYLERLYEEQQSQRRGIYNEKTTVKENNLSAVGYFMNVKLSETSLRVQVINVSTGEYEGNVTIKLQE